MDYLTGLMLHDFLLSPAHWSGPMAFAPFHHYIASSAHPRLPRLTNASING